MLRLQGGSDGKARNAALVRLAHLLRDTHPAAAPAPAPAAKGAAGGGGGGKAAGRTTMELVRAALYI